MKRVLIVANLFHASPRMPGIATYLPEYGWKATIVTPPVSTCAEERLGFPEQFFQRVEIVEAPYRGDIFWLWRKVFKIMGFKEVSSITEQVKERIGTTSQRSFIDVMLRFYQEVFAYPDTEKTWRKAALRAASDVLSKEDFDAILSSSPFPTTHIIASELKKRFGVPWLADFRDPWTRNHNYPFGAIRRHFEEKLEIATLRHAGALTTAAEAYAGKQEEIHKRSTTVITNGFDPETLNRPPIPLSRKFTITYTGRIYTGKQKPETLLAALEGLCFNGAIDIADIEIWWCGPLQHWLIRKCAEYGLEGVIRHFGIVSRLESIRMQQESQILLLFDWEDPEVGGVCPGKTFEYLAAQRPILVVGGFPGSEVGGLILSTKAGIHTPSVGETKSALLDFYAEFKQSGVVSYRGNLQAIMQYSYLRIAKKFSAVLNKVAE